MQWLNIRVGDFGRPEFIKADERQRGIWLSLLAYCVQQENSGIIDNCAAWVDREWLQICGVSEKSVMKDSSLWRWLDGSLIVELYPIDMQTKAQNLRERAEAGAAARWNAKRHEQAMPTGIDEHMPTDACRHQQADAEGKGKSKDKGKGEDKTPLRSRFKNFLKRMRLAQDDSAIDEWLALARELGVTGFDPLADMIEYAVDLHRQHGNEARYVRHVEQGCRNWAKMKRDTERISKESA